MNPASTLQVGFDENRWQSFDLWLHWELITGNLFNGKLVKRHILIDGIDHPITKCPAIPQLIRLKTIGIRIPRQIQPLACPVFTVSGEASRRSTTFSLAFGESSCRNFKLFEGGDRWSRLTRRIHFPFQAHSEPIPFLQLGKNKLINRVLTKSLRSTLGKAGLCGTTYAQCFAY